MIKLHRGVLLVNTVGKKTEYVLMNKNTPVLTFFCARNAFDEPEFEEGDWLVDYRPIGYLDLESFLARRQAPKHRRHIRELLERYGCDDLEGFLRVTCALSLNDTFWVRQASLPQTWETVSLYQNEFDHLISEAAFDGHFSAAALSSTSPEFGTDGFYAKCWVREAETIWLYKGGSALHEIEPVSEFLSAQIAQVLCPNYVSYDLATYHGQLVSKCRLFTNESVGLAKAAAVFRGEQTIPKLLEYYDSIGGGDDFRRMCVLDALICNHDRHYGNFGVLFNNDTMQILGMAPVFDHNRALFPELDEDQLSSPEWYIQHCRPTLGTDFILTARGLLTQELCADLESLRRFRFENHPEIPISENRLALLSSIVSMQIEAILRGV